MSLYHAMKFEHFAVAAQADCIQGRSTHRFHPNGSVPWPDRTGKPTKEYLESRWAFGVCLTRDSRFARSWSDVVLEFDRDALRSRHKLVPYDWFEINRRQEREEFLITGWGGFTCAEARPHDVPIDDEEAHEAAQRNLKLLTEGCVGAVKNLSRYLKSISVVCCDDYLLKRGPQLTMKAEADFRNRKESKGAAALPSIRAYGEEHSIPVVLLDGVSVHPVHGSLKDRLLEKRQIVSENTLRQSYRHAA